MTNHAASNRIEIAKIRTAMDLGQITYEEAKIKAAPIINEINARSKEIAKKYGKSHRNFTFEEIMR